MCVCTFLCYNVLLCVCVCVFVCIMDVCACICMYVCVTMSCPVVFTSGDSSVVSCCFIYYHILSSERITWFDLVMFSELVLAFFLTKTSSIMTCYHYNVFSGMCMYGSMMIIVYIAK